MVEREASLRKEPIVAKNGDGARPGKDGSKRLRKLIKNTRVAMFTTVAGDGTPHTRPMATLKAAFDGDLWFLTRATAPKAEEIRDNQHVSVSYVDPDGDRFACLTGTATLVRDPGKVAELWTRRLRDWFPEGKKDGDLALIRVKVDRAEVWDPKTASMAPVADLGRPKVEEDRRAPKTPAAKAAAPAPVTAGA
jgi:general stress protein 26